MKRSRSNGYPPAWTAILIGLWALMWGGDAVAATVGDEVPADPAIHSGQLSNGLRFVVLRHAPERHQVSLRLRIGAGSSQEPEGQYGVAHLLEHMAFRGSTHMADSEIWRTLARLGVAFGADSNAYTVASQTYFQFDLPHGDPASIRAGLMLMRDIASELTLDPQALNDERKVVLAEARLTDSPSAQAERAQTAFWFAEQPAVRHDAMGDETVIRTIGAGPLRVFYDAYYRPERATLVVVGDVDPDLIETEIRARFSDWVGKGAAGADPIITSARSGESRSGVFVQPGGPSSIGLAWVQPPASAPRSLAATRARLLADLAVQVLNHRFSALDGPCPVIDATRRSRPRVGDITVLTVDCPPGAWRAGLEAAETARLQILRYGVDQAETDRAADEALRTWRTEAAAAETAPAALVANALISRIDHNEPLSGPLEDLTLARETYDHARAAEVDQAMHRLFDGAGPLAFLASPKPVDGGAVAVQAALERIDASQPGPTASLTRRGGKPSSPIWPYRDFGRPGKVAERSEISDLGVTFVRFENGVRLTIKPTPFSAGQVLARVTVGGGRLDLPRDRISADWAADSGAIDAGGLRAIDRADMRRALSASVYSFSFSTGDDGFNLSGVTRSEDLDVQFQVLAAYATAPGWRRGAFEHIQSLFAALLPQFEASPGGVLGDYVGGLLHDGDPRWATPTLGDLTTAKPRELRALLERPLATGAIDVTVVGDVSVEQAIRAVAATLGALPKRLEATPARAALEARFPAATGSPVTRHHGGHADQALALTAWPTGDAYARNPGPAEMRVLQQVLNNRMIERLRIADGATYTPRTGLEASKTFPGFGYLFTAALVAPDKTDLVFRRIGDISADLNAHVISADELERARNPAVAAMEREQATDAYWLNALDHAQTDPRRLDLIRTALPDLRAVSAVGVRTAARAYLQDERAWKLIIAPRRAAAMDGETP